MTDEHHAEQPEQITDAEMLDAPDWAWSLADAIVLGNQGCGNAAVLIQRAFAAREAELVGALKRIATVDMGGGFVGAQACRKVATAALKSHEARHG